jgi:hypothetical protein
MLHTKTPAPAPQPSLAMLFGAFAGAGVSAGAVSLAFGQSLNFHVFRAAAFQLLERHDLYAKHAEDYFKYSPTFAFLFLPFAWLPEWLGAPLWSLANFMVACIGIERVMDDPREKRVALMTSFAGILLATDGDQSNLLVAGALLLALHAFERRHATAGAALVTGAAFVKLFPAMGALFALLARRRGEALRALAVSAVVWLALPILVMRPRTLAWEYASWGHLLSWDHANHGWCVMTLVQDALHLPISSLAIQLAGMALCVLPVVLGLVLGTDARWRRTFACSLLVFVVLFNHRAEYASFVLSAIAVGVWYAAVPGRSPIVTALVVLAIVAPGPFFTRDDPSVTGVFAVLAAHRQFHALRLVPLVVLWGLMNHELLSRFLDVKVRLLAPAREP